MTSNESSEKVNGSTFSRNALYAPLEAYAQNEVEPASYMGTRKSIPPGLHESSLMEFLQSVSYDYHRYQATECDPKNNGSRPISVADIEGSLKQRAITLVGGGINSSVLRNSALEVRRRKRKRPEWKQPDDSNSIGVESIVFLRKLNLSWNEYIQDCLGIHRGETSTSVIQRRFIASRSDLELAGAHVRINSCIQRQDLVDTTGVFVGESKNTWTIARRRKSSPKKANGIARGMSFTADPCELLQVPKRGSTLEILIPWGMDGNSSTGSSDEDTWREEELIEEADQSLSITIDPSRLNVS